jgi:hypothetical protein
MARFSRELLEDFFERTADRTTFPINDGDCLWGYFFTGYDRNQLEVAGQQLEVEGYRFVTILGEDKIEDEHPGLLFLHVERVERHSVDTLMVRNDQLAEFATRYNLDSYDGFDVGHVGWNPGNPAPGSEEARRKS